MNSKIKPYLIKVNFFVIDEPFETKRYIYIPDESVLPSKLTVNLPAGLSPFTKMATSRPNISKTDKRTLD